MAQSGSGLSLIAMRGSPGPRRSRSRKITTVAATVRWARSFSASCLPQAMLTSSAEAAAAYLARMAASGLTGSLGHAVRLSSSSCHESAAGPAGAA